MTKESGYFHIENSYHTPGSQRYPGVFCIAINVKNIPKIWSWNMLWSNIRQKRERLQFILTKTLFGQRGSLLGVGGILHGNKQTRNDCYWLLVEQSKRLEFLKFVNILTFRIRKGSQCRDGEFLTLKSLEEISLSWKLCKWYA